VVAYKCDSPYAPEAEGGIHFADPALAVEWPVARDAATVSGKDDALPPLDAIGTPFPPTVPMSAP
jgi:dTDP-4-dehydrorhamnose 3,5-epimerase